MNSIGERIFELRKSKGLSQGDLADKLNISRQTVSKWENNMSAPEIEKLVMLGDIFGVSIDYIIKGEQAETGPSPTMVTERIIIKEKTKKTDAKKAVGIGLLIASAALLPLSVESLAAYCISVVMAVVGIIVLVLKTKAEIYVLWSLYIAATLFCTFSTAISPLHFFFKSYYQFSEFSLVHIFDLLFLLAFFIIAIRTYKLIKNKKHK